MKFRSCLASAALTLMLALGGPASAAPPVKVRVSLSEAMPPASFVVDGQVNGMFRELLKALFSLTPGYQPEFHAYPWTRAQFLVEEGIMDLMITFPSSSRKEYANFSRQPVFTLDYGNLVYRKDSKAAERIGNASSFEDLRGLTFISQDMVAWETENVPAFIPRYRVNSPNAIIHMAFHRKTGDFFIMPAEQATYFVRQLGYLDNLAMKKVDFIPNSKVPFHVGIRKSMPGNAQLMAALEKAIDSPAFQARKQAIEAKYRHLVAAR